MRTGSDTCPAGTGSGNKATDHQPLYTDIESAELAPARDGYSLLSTALVGAEVLQPVLNGEQAIARTAAMVEVFMAPQSRNKVAMTRKVSGYAGVKSTSSQPQKRPSEVPEL